MEAACEVSASEVQPRDDAALLQENAQLKRQLAAATEELESFTYSVSHDLRASLRHISAFVEIINEDWHSAGSGVVNPSLNSDISNHLTTITDAAKHMTRMIDGLMALSQLGRVVLNVSRVALRPLIDEVLAALPPNAAHWRIADDFPPLEADPALVRQLLQHLMSNAVKFARPTPGRPVAQVEIGWRWLPRAESDSVDVAGTHAVPGDIPRQGVLCELFIKDNGAGFNPKFGSKLFGVFQRLHSASAFEGIGMGLALSRRIVERHGGSIAAISPVSPIAPVSGADLPDKRGCEVRFTLPAFQRKFI